MEIRLHRLFNFPLLIFLFLIQFNASYAQLNIVPCDQSTFPTPFDLEYRIDLGFHTSVMIMPGDIPTAWGQKGDWLGNNVAVPTPAPENLYTGIAVEMDISGEVSHVKFLRTTTGIYSEGSTIGGVNTTTALSPVVLPSGVNINQVVKMEASSYGLALLLSDGTVNIKNSAITSAASYGDGSTIVDAAWHKVMTASEIPLTGVVDLNYNGEVGVAITSTGAMYTWGKLVFLADGNTSSLKSYATLMSSLPTGVSPIQAKIHFDGALLKTAIMILGNDGHIYTVGYDVNGITGQGTTNTGAVSTWIKVLAGEQIGTGDSYLSDIIYMDINDVDVLAAAHNYIAMGAMTSTGNLFTWGENSQGLLSGIVPIYNKPHIAEFAPDGHTEKVIFFDVGAHVSVVFRTYSDYCYTGHYVYGSIGNGDLITDDILDYFTCGLTTIRLFDFCIKANDDDYRSTFIQPNAPTSTLLGNIIANDSLDFVPVDYSSIDIKLDATTNTIGLSVDMYGNLTISSGVSSGNYAVDYTICEKDYPDNCATATIYIYIGNSPVAVDDSDQTYESTTVNINVLTNDSDIDNNLDTTSVVIESPPSNGTVVVNTDGTINYTPNTDFIETDTFQYTVCDTTGMCDTATVTVTVNPLADLELTKELVSVNNPLQLFDTVVFKITVTNNGPGKVDGTVQVRDILPEGLEFLNYTTSSGLGTYDNVTGIWNLNNEILMGASEILFIEVKLLSCGSFKNTAEIISSPKPDPDSIPNNGK